VADEPVSMLDVSIRTELLRLMLDLREERGLTYVFITHDLSLAWVIADRIAVMYLGKIMEIGPADRVINRPHNPYTKALVSVAPTPTPPAPGTRAARTILVGETPDAAHVPTGCRFHPRCPLAFDRCRQAEPPLFDVGDGQAAACWLVEGGRSLPVMPAALAAAAAERDASDLGAAGDAAPGASGSAAPVSPPSPPG
jgi:oligopeptide/dipeptide ABC transporter ATP-binding protein